MSEYIDRAMANAKKLQIDQVMRATQKLVVNLRYSLGGKKVWAGFRKKLRRIL